MRIMINVDEAIMLESFKMMRKIAKDKNTGHETKSQLVSDVFADTMAILDKMGDK